MAARAVNITDRAHRYRANKLAPVAGKKCLLCGSTKNLVPDHWDGHPDHTNPANLEVLCKSCNTAKGAAFAKAGRGRLTNQYNPTVAGSWEVALKDTRTGRLFYVTVDALNREAAIRKAKAGLPATSVHGVPRRIDERQYNPTKGGGAANVGEWMNAVGAITPHVDRGDRGLSTTMSTRDAVDMIRATPQSKRRDFAAKLGRRNPAIRENLFGFGAKPAPVTRKRRGGLTLSEAASAATKAGRKSRDMSDFDDWLESKRLGDRSDGFVSRVRDSYKRGVDAAEADEKNTEYLQSLPKLRASKSATFKGRAIKPTEGGSWVVPSIDKESEFDTLQDAKAFITSWKRNPAKGAAEVYEEFHGFKPSEVVTVTKKIHYHAQLAAAGLLTHLDVWGIDRKGHRIEGFKGAFLAFNETKNQLFVEGGDQSVNLEDFGIDPPHELETLGRLTDIGYKTNKTHLGDEGGEAVYVHKFRTTNDNGKHVTVRIARYPDLIYDVRNAQLLFSGGSYEILREGINK
jgi:hypothetical protein